MPKTARRRRTQDVENEILELAARPEGVTPLELPGNTSALKRLYESGRLVKASEVRNAEDNRGRPFSVYRVASTQSTNGNGSGKYVPPSRKWRFERVSEDDHECTECTPHTFWPTAQSVAVHRSRIHGYVSNNPHTVKGREQRQRMKTAKPRTRIVSQLQAATRLDQAVVLLFGDKRLPTSEFVHWLDLTRELMNGER